MAEADERSRALEERADGAEARWGASAVAAAAALPRLQDALSGLARQVCMGTCACHVWVCVWGGRRGRARQQRGTCSWSLA